ncbi:MAG TPA: hypothetical protein VNV37_12005, partial [Solirubrobacteraceae bacterium]|nr:hypothetical protein [Solirubrobacteraceae bacterium]
SINGKREHFTVADLRAVGSVAGLPRGRAERIIAQVAEVVADWPRVAADAGVDELLARRIARTHRLALPRG